MEKGRDLKKIVFQFLMVLHQKTTIKTFERNMSRGTLSVLTPLSLEIFGKEKQKLPKVISQISQAFILVNIHCIFLLLEKIQKQNPINISLNQ